MNKQNPIDRKKLMSESIHLTRPPRLEGVVKNKMMNQIKKKKKEKPEESGKK